MNAQAVEAAASSLGSNLEGRFVSWLLRETPFLQQNVGRNLPLMTKEREKGYGLVAPEGGYAKGSIAMRLPPACFLPFSGAWAVKSASESAPGLLSNLMGMHGGRTPSSSSNKLVQTACLATSILLDLQHPYYQLLRENVDTSCLPITKSPDALTALQGSPMRAAIEKASQFHRNIFREAFQSSFLSEDSYIWALSMLLSRSTSGSGRPMTLLPYADFVNHSRLPSCTLLYGDDCFSLISNRRIDAFDELTIDYGSSSKSLDRFFRTYGFCDFDSAPPEILCAVSDSGEEASISLDWGNGSKPIFTPSAKDISDELMETLKLKLLALERGYTTQSKPIQDERDDWTSWCTEITRREKSCLRAAIDYIL
jgi:hypothetical protein